MRSGSHWFGSRRYGLCTLLPAHHATCRTRTCTMLNIPALFCLLLYTCCSLLLSHLHGSYTAWSAAQCGFLFCPVADLPCCLPAYSRTRAAATCTLRAPIRTGSRSLHIHFTACTILLVPPSLHCLHTSLSCHLHFLILPFPWFTTFTHKLGSPAPACTTYLPFWFRTPLRFYLSPHTHTAKFSSLIIRWFLCHLPFGFLVLPRFYIPTYYTTCICAYLPGSTLSPACDYAAFSYLYILSCTMPTRFMHTHIYYQFYLLVPTYSINASHSSFTRVFVPSHLPYFSCTHGTGSLLLGSTYHYILPYHYLWVLHLLRLPSRTTCPPRLPAARCWFVNWFTRAVLHTTRSAPPHPASHCCCCVPAACRSAPLRAFRATRARLVLQFFTGSIVRVAGTNCLCCFLHLSRLTALFTGTLPACRLLARVLALLLFLFLRAYAAARRCCIRARARHATMRRATFGSPARRRSGFMPPYHRLRLLPPAPARAMPAACLPFCTPPHLPAAAAAPPLYHSVLLSNARARTPPRITTRACLRFLLRAWFVT